MLRFVIVVAIATSIWSAPTTIDHFPYQVSLQTKGVHYCGGSIIAKNVVLTAFHCVRGMTPAQVKVRAGSTSRNSGGSLVGVAQIIRHEQYNPNTMENDISLLVLSESLEYNSYIKSIELAHKTPANGTCSQISGWGSLRSGSSIFPQNLQYVSVDIISNEECSSSNYGYGDAIQDSMICAGAAGKDACQGDSGGPLAVDGKLAGVVSWGIGCADPYYPGVYTDVPKLSAWINTEIAKLKK